MDTTDISGTNTLITILKWAATLIAAGFIAQFGKKFADYLIEKGKASRTESTHTGHSGNTGSDAPAGTGKESDIDKIQKKERKALIKKMKKSKKQ